MFTLITDRSRYFKVRRGQSAQDIEKVLRTPVNGRAFAGRIIKVSENALEAVTVGVGDTYRTVAEKYGVSEARLREINCDKPVYPTCKIFVPQSCFNARGGRDI